MGVTELQEQLEISVEAGISITQAAQQAMNENGQNISIFSGKRRKGMYCRSGQMERAAERVWWSQKGGAEIRCRKYKY